jgi:hypothetical protein
MCFSCPSGSDFGAIASGSGATVSSPTPSTSLSAFAESDMDDEEVDELDSNPAGSPGTSPTREADADRRPSVVYCDWQGCRQPIATSRGGIASHLVQYHGLPAHSEGERAPIECRWSGCTSTVLNISSHVQRSHLQRFACVCGRTFGREDARKRHLDRGTCERLRADVHHAKQGGRPAVASKQIAEVYRDS